MPKRTFEEEQVINASRKAIQDIDSLGENEAFCDFMNRLDEITNQMAVSILEDEMSDEDRNDMRQKRLGMLVVLRSPAKEREDHTCNLENLGAGINPDGEH
tara:strand:- start:427 stop:729 length:303 start_codon:yes stop_codon:yes gene_type:complete